MSTSRGIMHRLGLTLALIGSLLALEVCASNSAADTGPSDQLKSGDKTSARRDGKSAPAGDAATVSYTGKFPTGSGVHSDFPFTVGGEKRAIWTYVPPSLGSARPLLIVFHGTDGTGWDALSSPGTMALADSQKLVVVAPQARTMAAGDWDNHTAGQRFFETHPNTSPTGNSDLLLVQAIIVEAQRAYGCDPKRVYTLGFSNGGFFAIFAAMTLPDKIAAFAEAASGLVTCDKTRSCTFYSQTGTGCATLRGRSGYCSCSGAEKPAPLPTSGRKPPGYLTHTADDVTVSVYYTCNLAKRMQLLGYPLQVNIRTSGGHGWPATFAADAWPFLSQHALP